MELNCSQAAISVGRQQKQLLCQKNLRVPFLPNKHSMDRASAVTRQDGEQILASKNETLQDLDLEFRYANVIECSLFWQGT